MRVPLLALVLWASTLPAQSVELASLAASPTLRIESHLRVRSGPRRLSGRLQGVAGDTLLLRPTLVPFHMRVPLTATSKVQLRAGRASRARGALVGAGVGVLAGLFMGAVISDAFHGSTSDAVAISPFFFQYTIPAGTVVGMIVPGHRWVPVTLTQRITPTGHAMAATRREPPRYS